MPWLVHDAPLMVPVLPYPEASVTVVPLPSLKLYAATRPGGGVGVGDIVGAGVEVGVGVVVGAIVAVAVGVAVGAAVAVGVVEGDGVGATVAVAVAVGAAVAVAVAVGVGDPLAAATVVTVKLQPPAKIPESPGPSSNTYNDHVPFGVAPLKADNTVANGAAGAGSGKLSPPGEASE